MDQIIIPTLERITSLLPKCIARRGIYLQHFSDVKNFELVQFGFGRISLGISFAAPESIAHASEKGAVLVFSHNTYGGVSTFLYPFSADFPNEHTKEISPRVGPRFNSPTNITENDIEKIMVSFLESVISTIAFSVTDKTLIPQPDN